MTDLEAARLEAAARCVVIAKDLAEGLYYKSRAESYEEADRMASESNGASQAAEAIQKAFNLPDDHPALVKAREAEKS